MQQPENVRAVRPYPVQTFHLRSGKKAQWRSTQTNDERNTRDMSDETLDDRIARAREQGRENAGSEWWRGEREGDFIAGVIVEQETITGDYGAYVAYTLDTGAAKVKVGMTGTVLSGKVEEMSPAIGDVLSIEYLGRRKSGASGAEYAAYAVGLDRPAGDSAAAPQEGV